MPEAEERIVNLALFIAGSPTPVTAEQCRTIPGYPHDQGDVAFAQMFERDKRELRAAGLVLSVDRSSSPERYSLDRDATFASPISFSDEELLLLRASATGMLRDPGFPYPDDLRFALAKLMRPADLPAAPLSSLSADEDPSAQGELVSELTEAISRGKRASFTYTNVAGVVADRTAEPYGLFAQNGRWYLVGRDIAVDDLRVFTLARMAGTTIRAARPRHRDFERPTDFDVRSWMLLPFQYGRCTATARLRLSGSAANRAEALTGRAGKLRADGKAFVWDVPVADAVMLARWVVENGPGIEVLEPASARDALSNGLRRVAIVHEC